MAGYKLLAWHHGKWSWKRQTQQHLPPGPAHPCTTLPLLLAPAVPLVVFTYESWKHTATSSLPQEHGEQLHSWEPKAGNNIDVPHKRTAMLAAPGSSSGLLPAIKMNDLLACAVMQMRFENIKLCEWRPTQEDHVTWSCFSDILEKFTMDQWWDKLDCSCWKQMGLTRKDFFGWQNVPEFDVYGSK